MSGPLRLRVATFNIHGGRPAAGPDDLQATASAIRSLQADLAGLQEVFRIPVLRDQPARLQQHLKRPVRFAPAVGVSFAGFGNALVLREEPEQFRVVPLPDAQEPRSLAVAELRLDGRRIRFLATHLGLHPDDRLQQVERIAAVVAESAGPTLLAGDFNCERGAPELAPLLAGGLRFCGTPPLLTFPGAGPQSAIDHLLASPEFEVTACAVGPGTASDHCPLVAELVLA